MTFLCNTMLKKIFLLKIEWLFFLSFRIILLGNKKLRLIFTLSIVFSPSLINSQFVFKGTEPHSDNNNSI